MIRQNELRIGNWVSQKYAEYDLANNSKGYYFSNNQIRFEDLKWCEDYPDNYNPIPLTPEILEKCGFEYEDMGDDSPYERWVCKEYEELWVWEYNDSKEWFVCLGDGFEQGWYYYLHQLQNLYFALTGEELKVNL